MKTEAEIRLPSPGPKRKMTPTVLIALGAVLVVTVLALRETNLLQGPDPNRDPCAGKGVTCQVNRLYGSDDPCRFVRITDADRVLGIDVNAAPGRGGNECFVDTFAYSVVTSGEESYRTGVRGLTDRIFLGTEAYWDPRKSTLHVLTGTTYLSVRITRLSGPREKAIALAGLALLKIAPEPKSDG